MITVKYELRHYSEWCVFPYQSLALPGICMVAKVNIGRCLQRTGSEYAFKDTSRTTLRWYILYVPLVFES